jgi:threonine dehydrogenase-like Zn-dependent dehydrogenase
VCFVCLFFAGRIICVAKNPGQKQVTLRQSGDMTGGESEMKQDGMMDAVIFESIGHAAVVKRPVPQIKDPYDVLIKVEIASICGSDVHMLADPPAYPAKIGVIAGHEMAGIVEEVGGCVTTVQPGDHVILDPNVPCGTCVYCKEGMPNMCENLVILGMTADGVFAQYMLCPEKMIVGIEKDLSWERAMFAEPINCVYGAVKKIRLIAGETVLVLGAGPIGLLFAELLMANGASKTFVSEVSTERKEYAEKIGVTRVINPAQESLEEVILAETGGMGVSVVVDAVGVLIGDALACARKGGRILLFGQNFIKQQTIFQNEITRKALTVIGNYIGDFTLPATGQVLESGLIEPELLISHKLDLVDFQEGLAAMRNGTAMKVALYPWKRST